MISVKTPVLLITFNRSDNTNKVFEAIKKAKASKLYVFNDGPRLGNAKDVEEREKIRGMLKKIDWPCELAINFSDKNLGCGYGPSSAISWAFEKEEQLIILEDDCVPSQPFFTYCDHIIEKYKDDTRVWALVGRSHHDKPELFAGNSYTFSHYGFTWGWATWRRTWQHFDIEMKTYPEFIKDCGFKNIFFSKKEVDFFTKWYSKLYADKTLKTHVWDYQFFYSMYSNGGLFVVPANNLVENIGYEGVHYSGKRPEHLIKSDSNFEIKKEPKWVCPNRDYDGYYFLHTIARPFYIRAINKIKRLLITN